MCIYIFIVHCLETNGIVILYTNTSIMVPRNCFHFILLVLSLLWLSCRSEMEESDFDKWISWNVKNYQRKTIFEKRYRNVSGNGQGLDPKLKKAESNKIRLTVSQDGSAEFKSITDALNSIQPYNIRRVIISIAPGYYRYQHVLLIIFYNKNVTSSNNWLN